MHPYRITISGEFPVFDESACGEEEVAFRCMMSWNNRLCSFMPDGAEVRVKFHEKWRMFSSMLWCSDIRPVKTVC